MRTVLIGAVESTRVALEAMSRSAQCELTAVVTLPLDAAERHSDFVDLTPMAGRAGAKVVHILNINNDDAIDAVKAAAPDYIFVIGWSQICGPGVMALAPGRIVGYHPAPLPRGRGRSPIPWTILQQEPITAGSLFWMDEGVDSGPLLDQQFFHVSARATASSLYAQHMNALSTMLGRTLPKMALGAPPRETQNDEYATWLAKRTPQDGMIDWRRRAADIDRLIRAVGRPYPGAFSSTSKRTVTFWAAEVCPNGRQHVALPGQVIEADGQGFTVAAGDGNAVRVTEWTSSDGKPPVLHSRLGEVA